MGKPQPRHDTLYQGFREVCVGSAFNFLSRMPLRLYKAELTSKKRGYSRSAPRLPAGSTPRHAREAPAPRPASSHHRPRGGRERTRERGSRLRSAPHHPGSCWGAIQGAARRALGRCDTSAPGLRAPRGPQRPAQPPDPRGAPPVPAPDPAALTEQQQLDLARRLLAILAEVPVDHLTPLHRRLVLGAQGAAHGARSERLPPLPSSPRAVSKHRCLLSLRTRASESLPTPATPPPPTSSAGRGKRRSQRHRAALAHGRVPPLASLSAPEVPGFQALGTAAAALSPVVAQQAGAARRSSASSRRRGPASARPSRLRGTTPRARARARALGQRPLGRARARRSRWGPVTSARAL